MALGTIALGDPFRSLTNINALTLFNQLSAVNRDLMVSQLRLATGLQQPRMEDGPSFFSLQNKMGNQVRGKAMALDNIGDSKDMLSLAEAGLKQIDELLGRMRDLTVRGANDTLSDEQRDDINRELANLGWIIDQVADTTQFNESDPLLDGGFTATLQVGPNENDIEGVEIGDFNTDALGVEIEDVNVSDNESARLSIARIDAAINALKDQLSDLGAYQLKLSVLEDLLAASMAAEESQKSRFGDANIAKEQLEITRQQLFQQLLTSSLAAANVMPSQLIGGLLGGG